MDSNEHDTFAAHLPPTALGLPGAILTRQGGCRPAPPQALPPRCHSDTHRQGPARTLVPKAFCPLHPCSLSRQLRPHPAGGPLPHLSPRQSLPSTHLKAPAQPHPAQSSARAGAPPTPPSTLPRLHTAAWLPYPTCLHSCQGHSDFRPLPC